MLRVGLKEDVKVVDLTCAKGTVQTLTEARIMCTAQEKVCHYHPPLTTTHTPPTLSSPSLPLSPPSQDVYLYYFLLMYPGRTLVFVNSIDCLQRVRSLLDLLFLKPHPLHAHMQQRQRLKNLDR